MDQSDDKVVMDLAALERLLEKRRSETVAAEPLTLTFTVGETTLDEAERRLVQATLRLCSNNKTKTCTVLGISRPTLARKLKDYGGAA